MNAPHRSVALAALLAALAAATAADPLPPDVVWEQEAWSRDIAFSPDGNVLASGGLIVQNPYSFGRIDLFATSDGRSLSHAEYHAGTLIGLVGGLAFSPDGSTLATAHGSIFCQPDGGCSAERPGIYTWQLPGLLPRAGRTDLSPARGVAFAPDGQELAVSFFYDNTGAVRTHDRGDLSTRLDLPGHQYTASAVAFSPDGTLLASAGDDEHVRIWDAVTGQLVHQLFHGTYIEGGDPASVSFSPDGTLIAAGGSGYDVVARIWRVSDGALLHDLDAGLVPGDQDVGDVTVAFTPDGRHLAGGLDQYIFGEGVHNRGLVRFWNTVTGEVVLEYADQGLPPYYGGVSELAFSANLNEFFAYVVGRRVKLVRSELDLAQPDLTATGDDRFTAGLRLSPAHPNPLRSLTRLAVEVERAQHLQARVYDLRGRHVATLLDEAVAAGAPRWLSFDASELPSGQYLLRITGGGGVGAVERLTVLR